MNVVDKNNRSPRYLINENAISFTENYQGVNQKGNPIYDVVSISIVSNAAIMVYDDNNGIGYGNDLQYQRWHLSGATTGLVSAEAHNIYARLSRGEKKEADVIFSVRNYNTDGSITKRNEDGDPVKDEEGNDVYELEASDTYYYILIGTLNALTDVNAAPNRTLTFDPGYLSSQKSNNEQAGGWIAEMFDLVRGTEKLIRTKLRFEDIRVKGEAIFASFVSFYSGLKIGTSDSAKTIISVATDLSAKEDESEAIATPAYVKAFSEPRYLRYDIEDDQTVNGTVNFRKNVSVAGEHSVGGDQSIGGGQSVVGSQTIGRNQTIEGEQEVKGLQTLHEGFMTPNFNDAGGQVMGAQLTRDGLFSVAGLIANSFTIKELIYNVIRAQGGEYVFSPTVNIERCVYHMKDGRSLSPDDYYAEYTAADFANIDYVVLTLRDDELTHKGNPLEVGDIVYGYVNQVGESGQHATGGQCLMHVTAINELEVTSVLYQVGDRGVVANMPPAEGMTIAQRGTEDSSKTERMTSFYISAESGSVIMLDRVQSPTLSAGNYGASFGKLPTDLLLKVREYFSYIQETDPVVYARYGIFENLLQFDHLGRPIQRENNRGEWVSGEAYYNTVSYYDTVTYEGELWKCVADVTYDAPSSSNDWLLLVAKGKDKPMPNENLLDNTLRFDDNWTLGTSSLYKAEVEDGEDGRKVLHCTGRNMNLPFAKQFITGVSVEGGVNKVVADEWYTLSFELKGTSGGVRKVLSAGIVNESEVIYIDGVEHPYTDNMATESTDNWVRHSYAFKTVSAIPADAFVGFTFTMLSDFYLDKIKLERGKEVTPWTTSANDGIGEQGADGVSVEIVSTTVRYASHDSGSERPSDDKWSEILPSVADGSYLWTLTQVVYSTGDTTDSYSVSRMGVDGKGIQSAVVTYVQKENTDVQPKDFPESDWGEFPSSLIDGHWLYTRTVTTYSDGSISKSYSVTQNGQGSYYAGLQEYYAPSASSTVAPTGYPLEGTYPKDAEMTITGSWDKVRPSLSDATPYLWNFSVSFDSKGNRYVVAPVCIGNFAKGIKSIVETYAISAYSKPNGDGRYPTDIESWIIDEAQDAAPTEDKPYQWNKTETTYNDGTKEQFYHVSAVKGENGEDGKDGRGINSVSMEYAVTTTFEQPSLGSDEWRSERPSTIAEGSYLWTKTIVDYTDDSAVDTVGVTVSRIGANGTSVSVKKTEYAESSSATQAPTTGWSTSIPSVDEGNYLWTRTTFSDGKVAYSVAKNGKSLTIVSIKYSSVLNSSSQPAESTFTLTSMPTTKQGDYLWTLTTYSDGTKDYSKSYIPNDGIGINSTTISYGKSTSANVMPTSWQSEIPTVDEDEYLWTRTIIDYTDSSIEDTVSYTYSHQGKTGQAGTSVSVKSIKYQAGDSATTAPTGAWSDNVVEVPQGGYLWTKTEFSDGSTAYGSARQGADGKDGLTAQPNIIRNSNFDLNDGTYLKFWRNYWVDGIVNGTAANDKSGELPISEYVVSNAHEGLNAIKYNVPTPGHLFISNGDAKITIEKGFIYTFSCVAKYTGQSTNSSGGIFGVRFESLPLSAITSVGDNDDIYGVGGSNHTEIYFGKVGDEWTKRSFTFSLNDSYENDTAVFRLCGYAWGKDITVYYSQIKLEISRSATPYVKHVDDNKGEQGIQGLQGIQGERGEQGIQGETGADGRPSYFHIKYASDNKGSGMNDVGGEYIGTYTDNVAQDSNDPSKYTWVLVKGAQGEKGDQGIKGENGEDGTSSYLHIAYANSSDGSVDFSVSDSNRKYIGQYIDTLVNDSTDYRSYKWSHIEGPQGLTPQPNILHNTNFDVLDANGNLVNWKNIVGDVIPNGYLSYNSFKTRNTGTRARIQLPTMKKGDVFTFSCVARIGGTESVYCGGITINNSSITSRNLVGIYTPMWNATDFCFKNTSEWTERKFTFEYTGDSELSGALLSLYVWGGWCEYSTIKLEKGEDATPYVKHVDDNKGDKGDKGERGIAGPQGENGGTLLHRGNYDPKTVYRLSRNEDGSVFGYPIVYLPAEQGLGSYLTLKKDMEAVNSDGYPIDANGNVIEANNTEYWKITPYQEQVFTKFLMANYAQLGSDKGAVFFDRFLFSQYGVNKKGEVVHYTDYDDVMWDEDGTLNGEFTPSLAIDMYSGYVKANKIAETFAEYQYQYDYLLPDGRKEVKDLYANEIDFNQTYNIKYSQYRSNISLLTTPLANDIVYKDTILAKAQADTGIDGLKCIIVNRADTRWTRKYHATLGDWDYTDQFAGFVGAVLDGSLLLCGDPRLFNPYSWQGESYNGTLSGVNNNALHINDGSGPSYESARFVLNGYFTDFLILAPGSRAILRSCRSTTKDKTLYWYVENADDFVDIPYRVEYLVNSAYSTNNGELETLNSTINFNLGWDNPGVVWGYYRRTFMSKAFAELYEHYYPNASYSPKFGIEVRTNPLSGAGTDTDWTWERDIAGLWAHDVE